MNKIFEIVAITLNETSRIFSITYNEINIIVYYLLIPLSWAIMVDYIIVVPIFTILTVAVWAAIIIVKLRCFRQWCDRVFDRSQRFLLWFRRVG